MSYGYSWEWKVRYRRHFFLSFLFFFPFRFFLFPFLLQRGCVLLILFLKWRVSENGCRKQFLFLRRKKKNDLILSGTIRNNDTHTQTHIHQNVLKWNFTHSHMEYAIGIIVGGSADIWKRAICRFFSLIYHVRGKQFVGVFHMKQYNIVPS